MSLLAASSQAPAVTVQDVKVQIESAHAIKGQLIGDATVETSYVGITGPGKNDPVGEGIAFQGTYKWLLSDADWVVVKKVRETKLGVEPGDRTLISRPHNGSVLTYEMFTTDKGKVNFLTGYLGDRWDVAFASGAIGRVWVRGNIEMHLDQIDSPSVIENNAITSVKGSYRGSNLTIIFDKSKGMLASDVQYEVGSNQTGYYSRTGYHIDEFAQVDGIWVAKHVKAWSGVFKGDQLFKGSSSDITYEHIESYAGGGWPSALPKMPVSSVIGSDDSRLYRVAEDGELIYWGEKGHKASGRASLVQGNIFVLSGAGLLLACLWKVFNGRHKSLS